MIRTLRPPISRCLCRRGRGHASSDFVDADNRARHSQPNFSDEGAEGASHLDLDSDSDGTLTMTITMAMTMLNFHVVVAEHALSDQLLLCGSVIAMSGACALQDFDTLCARYEYT